MYDREYKGKTLNFEPSGGLMHASLVMRDKETDSYWSIMTGDAVAGPLEGTPLDELPAGKKVQWKDWVAEHPDTKVLSVDGEEQGESGYERYFSSQRGFRGLEAEDKRLATKQPIFTFKLDGTAYAVPFQAFQGGAAFQAGQSRIFLYRRADAAIFYSTRAFRSAQGFEQRGEGWYDKASGARFDPGKTQFVGGEGQGPSPLEGFDTFWYTWSLNNPGTKVLGSRKGAKGAEKH